MLSDESSRILIYNTSVGKLILYNRKLTHQVRKKFIESEGASKQLFVSVLEILKITTARVKTVLKYNYTNNSI